MTGTESMSGRLALCMKKDKKEFIRKGRLLICLVFLGVFMLLLLLISALIPALTDMISEELGFLSDAIGSMVQFLRDFFPDDLMGSAAFYSTEMGLFYTVLVIAFAFNLLPGEIKSGRLILPSCNGYSQKEIFLSKQIVYSAMSAVPAGIAYILYCLIGGTFLIRDYPFGLVLVGAAAMMINVFSVVAITIALSVIYRHSVLVIITMGLTVAASPDLLHYLPFGKYIPTYVFTYLNYVDTVETSPVQLIIPIIEYAVIIVLLDLFVIRRGFSVIVDERR